LSALRARTVHARSGNELPLVMLDLYDLHSAVADGYPSRAARAAARALARGATAEHVIQVVGFGGLYAPADSLEDTCAELEAVLGTEASA
jgi:hypothetical protein